MNKVLIVTGVIGAAALMLAVETWATDASPPAGKEASSGTYTGCLAKGDEPNEFKLTNVNGGSEEYELIGGKGLKNHVGHKVEVEGKLVSAEEAAKVEKASGEEEESESEAEHEHLRVSSMRHVAATCP